MSKEVIKEEINISDFHIPRWEELPTIDLYLDQLVTYLETYLKNYIGNSEDTLITKTMINNYVKQGVLQAPIKKKYNKTHIAYLFVICILKQIYSIQSIDQLIKLAIKTSNIENAYNKFCINLEKSINLTFAGKEYIDEKDMTHEKYLLKNVVQSFANKLYVEKTFLYK